MRGLLYTLSAMAVIGLAYWAYNENYATQEAMRRVKALQSELAKTRETLGVLKAEWAYLNRPDRLRELVDLNFERLQLMPLAPEHFGDVRQVAYPRIDLGQVTGTVDAIAETDGEEYP